MSIFDSIKVPKPKRSTFDLSHDVKLTTDFGRLTPFLCTEVMPGDSFKCESQVFARLAPMQAPVLQKMDVYTHYFFVPYRLLWSKWEEFITGGEDGLSMPAKPYVTLDQLEEWKALNIGSLADHLGLPIELPDKRLNGSIKVDDLPFRAYALIWNEWYRDQNLQEEIDIDFDMSGQVEPSTASGRRYFIQNRCWKKDYFTSSLPWPQRGPDMRLPMSGDPTLQRLSHKSPVMLQGGGSFTPTETMSLGVRKGDGGKDNQLIAENRNGQQTDISINPQQFLVNAENLGPTINEFRRSLAIQKWLEANARGGSRYIEQILSHFGVVSSDARLQRPELLGGGKSPVLISEVVQTSPASGTESQNSDVLGGMGGHGVSAQNSHGFKRYFEEHGLLIGIMSFMPKASYDLGVQRMWSRFDKYDYPWPEFANLGEQEVLQQELYAKEDGTPEAIFGYVPRYAEFKYMPSQIHGDFRFTMSYWHMGRAFSNPPQLNSDFVQCGSTPSSGNQSQQLALDRIFAYKGTNQAYFDHIWVQVYNKILAKRPLPYYGTPQI